MNKRKIILSIFYSLGQISLGLVLHPYKTMQSMVREKVFIWMTLLPTLILMFVTLLWQNLIVPVASIFFSCSSSLFFNCNLLFFIANVIAFYCLYWQMLLLYLLLRFHLVFRRKI